jgi:hypothetical protein
VQPKKLIRKLQSVVTPELIQKRYRGSRPLSGACYIVSEALYHLWGKASGYAPATIALENGTHWFLVKGNVIVDPTVSQFDYIPTYTNFHHRTFLTKQPSKRAQVLINRVS